MIRPKYEQPARPTKAQEADAYEIVTLRDLGVCQRCRRDCGPFNRDHRKNRSQGGQTRPSNLQGLGGTGTTGCHGWKTTNPADAIAEGWQVPGYADPTEWPARRWLPTRHGTFRPAWVLYDDLGNITEITDDEAMRRMGKEAS